MNSQLQQPDPVRAFLSAVLLWLLCSLATQGRKARVQASPAPSTTSHLCAYDLA